MQPLGKADLGVSTFYAAAHPHDQCGADGLPLTPNSIKILGRLQRLKALSHPRLCQYVDVVRGKHERVMVVCEHYRSNVQLEAEKGTFKNWSNVIQLIYEVLEGLAYLNSHGLVHRALSPANLLLDTEGHAKLANHGLYYMTEYAACVSFPIGHPRYMAPEVLATGPIQQDEFGSTPIPSGPKVDIWSLGIIIMEICLGMELWSSCTLPQLISKVLLLGKHSNGIHSLETILREHGTQNKFQELPDSLQSFLRQCLTVSPDKRPSPSELLVSDMFKEYDACKLYPKSSMTMFQYPGLRSEDLQLDKYIETVREESTEDHLELRSLAEVYYLWGLAGGDLEAELRKKGLLRSSPPICNLADLLTECGDVIGLERDSSSLYDDTVVTLSMTQLKTRMENIDDTAFYPLLEDEKNPVNLPTSPSTNGLSETATLPLIIREKDIEYQFHRVVLYDRLLRGYPYTIGRIFRESRIDTPPLYRAEVWAALLAIEGDFQAVYDSIDKETPTTTDRQIEVDIPRCHQYSELLSSPEAHRKFKRILKAWVVSHPHLTYWQGLDSLSAPFLFLNFNNEALAYACLSAFIPKYLYKFFMKDNSAVIQEYLAVFSHLIAFHDPELSNHMNSIGFIPELYAIPWFLTMFSHVFPLHKIFHLWDTLLLGNSSFPLCIGVSILQQLRASLLSFGFNECILLFSDMPEIDIEKCVRESIRIFCNTPKSATYRQHAKPPRRPDQENPVTSQIKPVSYYSTDYNDVPLSELSREPLSLAELKTEVSPRISAEDLLELCDLKPGSTPGSRSPTKKNRASRPLILTVDVRSSEDFVRGNIPGSVNIPFNQAFSPEGDLVLCKAVTLLNNHKGRVVVVVGNRGKNASNFATQLVRLGFPKVCVMHGGIECLRPTGILAVSSPDLV
ncbi:TBC domain-containing protein kinase-like protein [Acanthaster planci]|uniref:TBC domain-containing protein kinase-like protein n=1 Tax=Acanthaster planci TaxID=133434 RepID=A0A8B7XUF3_ACAPL|nr:TBC domain-containing protein kinase-like protein [Acanthaster planci]